MSLKLYPCGNPTVLSYAAKVSLVVGFTFLALLVFLEDAFRAFCCFLVKTWEYIVEGVVVEVFAFVFTFLTDDLTVSGDQPRIGALNMLNELPERGEGYLLMYSLAKLEPVALSTWNKSDNIPSIFPKCGPKTAYNFCENVLEFDEKLKEKNEYIERYKLNKILIDFNEIPEELQNEFINMYFQ